MPSSSLEEQLTKYLTDVHSIEQQALAQMKLAPRLAGDDQLARAFTEHLAETEEHERLIRDRLQARGAHPSKVKDLFGAVTGMGFAAFAAAQPDTPGKLVTHAYSYEHMEEAAYDLLGKVAARAEDAPVVATAIQIMEQEHRMGSRLEGLFDRAAEIALRQLKPEDFGNQLDKYLADAHAIEGQSLVLLDKATKLAGSSELATAYAEHRDETEGHHRRVAERLRARGAAPSKIKDAALRIGGLNWGVFFTAQPDTPAKLAAFAYAVEHLEIAGYEMLIRVAERAGDPETVQIGQQIMSEERAAARRVRALFDEALDAALSAQGVA